MNFSRKPDYFNIGSTLDQIGDPSQAFAAVKDTRGENLGSMPHPLLQGKSPEELALYDRFASARHNVKELGLPMAALGTLPMAAYEGIKGVEQNIPFARGILGKIGGLFGSEKSNSGYYDQDQTTSPASLENVFAYLKGLR